MIGKITSSAGAEQLISAPETIDSQAGTRAPAAGRAEPGRFQEALRSLAHEIDRGEKLVDRALSGGGHLGAGDLIALQAGIYRYSEAVDLAAKLVDRAANAVRTTLQSSGG